MVLCNYFLKGNCRFGSKCHNDHIDIKIVIKTEVESAIKGKQWPLSCFGPFKDAQTLPNFIDDQSFEEVRYMCYEAKKQQCFPVYVQQFSQQVLDSKRKMEALFTLSPEIINNVIKIYNTKPDTTQNKQITEKQNLPANHSCWTSSEQGNINWERNNNQSMFPGGNQTQSIFQQQNLLGVNQQGFQLNNNQSINSNLFQINNNNSNSAISGGNLFVQQQQIPNSGMILQQQSLLPNQQNIQHNSNIFGQPQQQSLLPNQQNIQHNSNIFAQQTNEQQNNLFNQPSLNFQVGSQIQPQIGMNSINQQNIHNQLNFSNVYSKLENLPPEAIEAFNAQTFVLGKVPTMPPPQEFCRKV